MAPVLAEGVIKISDGNGDAKELWCGDRCTFIRYRFRRPSDGTFLTIAVGHAAE